MKMAHSPKYIAMAAPNLIKFVPIFFFVIPSQCSPIATTASCKASMTFCNVTCVILSLITIAEIGVSLEVPGLLFMQQMIPAAAQTGQSGMSPDAICVIVSIFLSFFCFLKVNETQSEYSSSEPL